MNKDSKEEFIILEKLHANIKTDSVYLKYQITRIQTLLDTLNTIETEMKDEHLDRFSINLYPPLLTVIAMDLERTTWQNLKSTGKLNLIKNTFLMDSLQFYYAQFENINKNWQEGFQIYNRSILAPKFFEFDDLAFDETQFSIIKNDVQRLPPYRYGEEVFFRNAVRYRIGILTNVKTIFEADFFRATNLLVMLYNEIESQN